eukprot:TRINITY_DN32964_c0_g1_i1.p1 TRINITY_DN32964_c0_g1~~TRINITY_DN32964_c0_g1_i1.p1  ORF type:complete len:565 (+),score=251.33 TRINITY_DN32964_c0_g1_i1:71-1696(+)
MPAEYEFMIGIQSLKGLPDAGTYCIAWRKGAETGSTSAKVGAGQVVEFAEAVRVREVVEAPAEGAKDLFEVHVQRCEADRRETIGMLYMDLSMHVPKLGKQGVKQAACLQLSNCAHPSVRLSLTVQCFAAGLRPVPQEGPRGAMAPAPAASALEVRELRDEVARLRRENERLKSEDSYSYTNQPIRAPGKEPLDGTVLQLELEKVRTELNLARQRAAADAETHKDRVRGMELQHMKELGDFKALTDKMKASHSDELQQCKLELAAALQRFADHHKAQGGARSQEVEDLRAVIKGLEEERDALRRQTAALTANNSQIQHLRDDDAREKRELSCLSNALESQQQAMADRLRQVEGDYQSLQQSSAEERAATEEAKHMLAEMMNRIREAQTAEETLQQQLTNADEEKKALVEQNMILNKTITALHEEMHNARDEEKARAHLTIADLQAALAVERQTKEQQVGMNKKEIQTLRTQTTEMTTALDKQTARVDQKKKRIADLKRILGLHLKMKQAHNMAFGDLGAGDDGDAFAALTSVQTMMGTAAP